MRRIITANDSEGRSHILKQEEVEAAGAIWQASPAEPMGSEPTASPHGLQFPAGALVTAITIPPEAVMAEYLKAGIPGLDEKGFHRTGTLDIVVLLEGQLVLELDRETVALAPGDVVVQRDTRHAWRNPGDRDARCLAVILRQE